MVMSSTYLCRRLNYKALLSNGANPNCSEHGRSLTLELNLATQNPYFCSKQYGSNTLWQFRKLLSEGIHKACSGALFELHPVLPTSAWCCGQEGHSATEEIAGISETWTELTSKQPPS